MSTFLIKLVPPGKFLGGKFHSDSDSDFDLQIEEENYSEGLEDYSAQLFGSNDVKIEDYSIQLFGGEENNDVKIEDYSVKLFGGDIDVLPTDDEIESYGDNSLTI